MTELKELFKKRAETFKSFSDQIFNSLPNVIGGCKKFVAFKGADQDLLNWEEIKFVEEHDIVLLVGYLSYKPGDTVVLPSGESIVVNENTAEYFKAMLHIAIPYKLATSGTVEDVYEFLVDTMDMEENEEDEENVITEEQAKRMLAAPVESFDLEELDEEQKEKLKMYMASNNDSGEKN